MAIHRALNTQGIHAEDMGMDYTDIRHFTTILTEHMGPFFIASELPVPSIAGTEGVHAWSAPETKQGIWHPLVLFILV